MTQIVQFLRGPTYDESDLIYCDCLIVDEDGVLEEDRVYYDTMGDAIGDIIDIQIGPIDMEEEWFDPETEMEDDDG